MNVIETCPLCHKTWEHCQHSINGAPFALYDRHGHGCGQFANLGLALQTKRFLDNSSNGPTGLFDRYGAPFIVNQPTPKTEAA